MHKFGASFTGRTKTISSGMIAVSPKSWIAIRRLLFVQRPRALEVAPDRGGTTQEMDS